MTTLRNVSDGLAAAVAAITPSVVGVHGHSRPSTGIAWSAELVVTASHTIRR